jgi:hypothetical protein
VSFSSSIMPSSHRPCKPSHRPPSSLSSCIPYCTSADCRPPPRAHIHAPKLGHCHLADTCRRIMDLVGHVGQTNERTAKCSHTLHSPRPSFSPLCHLQLNLLLSRVLHGFTQPHRLGHIGDNILFVLPPHLTLLTKYSCCTSLTTCSLLGSQSAPTMPLCHILLPKGKGQGSSLINGERGVLSYFSSLIRHPPSSLRPTGSKTDCVHSLMMVTRGSLSCRNASPPIAQA